MPGSITAIIKPTHECNLRCKYCYVERGAEQGYMDSKTLERTVQQLMTLPERNRVHFIWHGGEPLLMGTDFYAQAVEVQKRYKEGKSVENGMQSNATLVTPEVLDFCEQNDFNIGSSMDGPEDIHNLTRVYEGNKGSFQDVWRGVQMIRQRNTEIRKRTPNDKRPVHLGGGVITILNRLNIGRLNETYDFFKANGMSIKINPLIKSGRATENYEDLGIGAAEYGQALVSLFDRWFYEPEEGIDVDPLSTILGNLMTGTPTSCNFGKSCREGFISIGPRGDVYPCGRFDGVKEYWLGNINETGLAEILESRQQKMMAQRSAQTVQGCGECNYGKICNAECTHNAYMQSGDINGKDFYCASYKLLFKHLDEAHLPELEKARATPEEVAAAKAASEKSKAECSAQGAK